MESEKPKIVFIHLLNNFSGSPNVLSVVIKGFLIRGYKIDLITSHGDGFLSKIEGVNYKYTCYCWLNSKWITAFLLILSQIDFFLKILFLHKKNTIYYINTIIPIGAAWACYLTDKKFVYHVHENMQQKKTVYGLYRQTYTHCNRKSIFVSQYLKSTALNCHDAVVVYNGLDATFVKEALEYSSNHEIVKQSILMISSLRRYKGVYEFAALAKKMKQFQFELVLSASIEEVNAFCAEEAISENLKVFSTQTNIHKFYMRARLLLQLSHPESWIETFGLSILEAMIYGVPAIVPNVGGPTELIEDGVNGYLVNPHNLPDIISKIQLLMTNDKLYNSFSERALEKSKEYSEERMVREIETYILK